MHFICGSCPTDDALPVQIFKNRLSSDFGTFFIAEIVGVECAEDRIGTILRNTRFFDRFYGIQNVNHSLTSTCAATKLGQ